MGFSLAPLPEHGSESREPSLSMHGTEHRGVSWSMHWVKQGGWSCEGTPPRQKEPDDMLTGTWMSRKESGPSMPSSSAEMDTPLMGGAPWNTRGVTQSSAGGTPITPVGTDRTTPPFRDAQSSPLADSMQGVDAQ